MKYSALILGLICAVVCFTQSHAQSLTLTATLNGHTLKPGTRFYSSTHGDSIQIDKLKFYLSNVFLHKNTGEKVQVGDHHLFDLKKSSSLDFYKGEEKDFFSSKAAGYSHLSFCVGVDSLVNESGAQGGILDPALGMYWAWNSGYINFKLEGYSPLCPTRKQKFQLHIGGFMAPYASIREVVIDLPVMANMKDVGCSSMVLFPIDELLSKIDLSQQHTIMSPSKESMLIADLFSHSFKIKTLK